MLPSCTVSWHPRRHSNSLAPPGKEEFINLVDQLPLDHKDYEEALAEIEKALVNSKAEPLLPDPNPKADDNDDRKGECEEDGYEFANDGSGGGNKYDVDVITESSWSPFADDRLLPPSVLPQPITWDHWL